MRGTLGLRPGTVLRDDSLGKVLFNTVVPHFQFNKTYVAILIAVLGTTISPYLFFWQNMERLEDLRAEAAGGSKPLPLGDARSRLLE